MTGVDLHIAELVLHGFAPGDRHEIAAVAQRELGLLLDRSGWDGRSALEIDAGAIELQHGARAAAIGVEIARAIHRGATR